MNTGSLALEVICYAGPQQPLRISPDLSARTSHTPDTDLMPALQLH